MAAKSSQAQAFSSPAFWLKVGGALFAVLILSDKQPQIATVLMLGLLVGVLAHFADTYEQQAVRSAVGNIIKRAKSMIP